MPKKLFSDISTVHFTAIYYTVMVSYLVGSLSMVIFICKKKKKLFTDIPAITRHAREQFRERKSYPTTEILPLNYKLSESRKTLNA